MKLYTKTGDLGETALFGGQRVMKDHPRVDTYGAVDETNAAIGAALSLIQSDELKKPLATIQRDLFAVGARLADPKTRLDRRADPKTRIDESSIQQLEGWIDQLDAQLPPLKTFILPGGSPAGALLHLARTQCRRAERATVALSRQESIDPLLIVYLNRLSDLLFVFARFENNQQQQAEISW